MPKYLSIANEIEQQIRALPPGTQLPTEKELMGRFGVSRQTIRNAFACLSKKDMIYTVKGAGTFVANHTSPAPTSKNIAVLITDAHSYIFPYKSAAINSVLTKHGYISNIFITGNRIDYEENIIRELMTANYAGAIIEINKAVLPRANHLIEELSQRMPVILLDGYYPNFPQIPYVSLDNRKGGYRATEYLIQHGHQKIFHVGKVDDLQGLLRYQGYISALAAYHLPFDEDRVFWATDLIFPEMPEAMLDILFEKISSCTAVFFYNDDIAARVIPALQARGVRIPEDLSVMSYDNSLLAMHPLNLSGMAYPLNDLGRIAAENLLARIQDPHFDATYIFEPELVERSSVRDIRNTEKGDPS